MMKRTLATVFVCLVLTLAGATGAQARCGDEGQRACPVTVQLKGCNGKRVEVRGRCESCGANGQRACPITVQLKGCNGKQIEVKGRCEPCGAIDQRACPFSVAMPSCQAKLIELGGRCKPSAEFVADPFTIFNKTDKSVFYTVHLDDPAWKTDNAALFTQLAEGTLAPGGKVEVALAGNTCLPSGVARDNAGAAFSGATYDSCSGKAFGITFWKTEKHYRDRVGEAGATAVLRAAHGKAASVIAGGGVSGVGAGQIATRYFDWVINDIYGVKNGQIPYAWAITGIVPNVPQEGLWVAYWGEKRPVETGLYKGNPPNLSKLTPPCSRAAPAKFALVVGRVETHGTWSCGAIHTPQ
jgi:hypothetical protein